MSPMGKCLMDVVKKFLVKFPVVQLLTWSICHWSSSHLVRDSMYRALSYSARLDQPAAGKVLETANGGCLVDQKSGTENYKWSVRGKGMETWPKAFSKYHF